MSQSILIVGAGLYGAVCAYELSRKGYTVTVIDKRNHVGGNLYTRNISGIPVHCYGAHIFHTSDKKIWDYINQFGEFNSFINSPIRDNQNSILYDKYLNLARDYPKVIFGGRLGLYRYINMDKTIELALKMIETRFK